MQYIDHYSSPLGPITLAGDGTALTGLWFEGQKYFGSGLPSPCEERPLGVFAAARRWLDLYFRGEKPDFTPPLAPRATPFRQAVWALLLAIPYGQVTTYGDLADTLARQMGLGRMSAQAVGAAVGHNPISLIIPCHRVVGRDGGLTGYAGGLDKKIRLLALEGVDATRLRLPFGAAP